MLKRQKNITWIVSIDERLRQPVRIDALKAGKPVSQSLSEIVSQKLGLGAMTR